MKIICHIEDDIKELDMIFIGRAIHYLKREKPEGMGGLRYGSSNIEVSYIKNKSSYSIWARYDEGRTN